MCQCSGLFLTNIPVYISKTPGHCLFISNLYLKTNEEHLPGCINQKVTRLSNACLFFRGNKSFPRGIPGYHRLLSCQDLLAYCHVTFPKQTHCPSLHQLYGNDLCNIHFQFVPILLSLKPVVKRNGFQPKDDMSSTHPETNHFKAPENGWFQY